MKDYLNLTLSDFYEMDIGVREDGSLTVIIDRNSRDQIKSVLIGFKGSHDDSDIEIKEAAFRYYQELKLHL